MTTPDQSSLREQRYVVYSDESDWLLYPTPWSVDALGEAEWLLGWYSEDVERAALVSELERTRRDLRSVCSSIGRVMRDLQTIEERGAERHG